MSFQFLAAVRSILLLTATSLLCLQNAVAEESAAVTDSAQPALNFDAPVIEQKKEDAFSLSPWARLTPSFELRFLLLLKERPSSAGREGLGLMQAIAGLDWNLSKDAQVVTRYNLGFLGPGVRELYVDFPNYYFDSLKVGRFPLTFGLLLSDHRVYTKRFFGVSINDFETGFAAQKSYGPVKITLSLVQGQGSGEAFQSNEIIYTPAVDVRFDSNIGELQYTVGGSGFQTIRAEGKNNAAGDNANAFAAFLRTVYKRFSLSAESVWGYKRSAQTPGLSDFMGSSPYAKDLGNSSLGFYASPEYALSPKWKVFYEYDQVVLDTRYKADRFEKHGIGAKWAFSESADLETRVELLDEGRKENPDLRRDNNDVIVTLHAWF